MRIGHVGTGGTGKSVLALLLAERTGLTYRSSIVREVMAERNLMSEEKRLSLTKQERYELQTAILTRKLDTDARFRDGVFDRTPIDHLAYLLYDAAELVDDQTYGEILARIQPTVRRYDIILYHPIYAWHQTNLKDGVRLVNRAYHATIDALIYGLLIKLKVPYVTLPEANPDQLRDLVVQRLREMRKEREGATSLRGREVRPTQPTSQDPPGSTSQDSRPAEETGPKTSG